MNPSLPLAHLLVHAADAVQAVRGGASLTDALARVPPPARAGTQALSFHALRWLGGGQVVREMLAPRKPAPNVDALLTTALALLWPVPGVERPPYPEHTLVDQAVAAARTRTPAAAGFLNAVLRRFVRERDALVAKAMVKPLAAYNHPSWWVERVRQDWPVQWQALLQANNRRPPMTLRVNARRGTAQAYVQRLAAQGRAAVALGAGAVMLEQPCPVSLLPGFGEGEVSVQDAGAQLAAPLLLCDHVPASRLHSSDPAHAFPFERGAADDLPPLRLPPAARVLDACAAPGGKTTHLLELADLDLLALDVDALRLQRVQETLNRLDLHAELKAADARDVRAWWDGRAFDAILLDAPCTASGIVRRHPDVRWLRRPGDIAALAAIQCEMLEALWPLLKPGGKLLYVTCSLFKTEGVAQIDAFLQRHEAEQPRLDPQSPGQLLPLADNPASPGAPPAAAPVHDGFYYALIHKPSSSSR
ncbi:MAG TPA: 16S rRNA (cytosine(967)-C(5))-methyltransferase RsmB [Burkholderiaceae bacterium]|nr:16S rRNA (cytosine(967)-C(5))-methyltransferase RsmB [Burkholderiaceae bacterium]